jgi:hypothetical protein
MTIDGTNGLTFNNATVQNSGGKVIQVVNAIYGTSGSTSSTSYTDTGLTATITPLFATSKILVIVNQQGVLPASANQGGAIAVLRNIGGGSFTNINQFTFSLGYLSGSLGGGASTSAGTSYLDSPATTSACIYKTQYAVLNGGNGSVNIQNGGEKSTITLMEISA